VELDLLLHSCGGMSCCGAVFLRSLIDEASLLGHSLAKDQGSNHPVRPHVVVRVQLLPGVRAVLCLHHQQRRKRWYHHQWI